MKKDLYLNGFKQNSIRIETYNTPKRVTPNPQKTQEKYEVLERVELPNGYIEGIVVKDYPINSESISSLAEGADYKNDPMQAIAKAPERVNLGDITQAQKFLENPQNFARMFRTVQKALENFQTQNQLNSQAKSQPNTQVQNQQGGND